MFYIYFDFSFAVGGLFIVLMHFVQAFILVLPRVTHCKFGNFLLFVVGLYFPRSLTKTVFILDVFSQTGQVLDIFL